MYVCGKTLSNVDSSLSIFKHLLVILHYGHLQYDNKSSVLCDLLVLYCVIQNILPEPKVIVGHQTFPTKCNRCLDILVLVGRNVQASIFVVA